MSSRANAVTFKGEPKSLAGPEVKTGQKAPDFQTLNNGLAADERGHVSHTLQATGD